MNKIVVYCLLFAGVLLTPAAVLSQQRITVDLEGAQRYALDHNKRLTGAALAMSKSSMALREAIANGLPQVNATADYSNALGASISIVFNPDFPATEIPIRPSSNLYVNVGQLIFSGNYIVGIQLARLGESLTGLQYKQSHLEVITQTTEAYHLVLISGELLGMMRQNESNLKSLYGKMEAMEAVGMIESIELDQLSVQVNTLENAVRSAERQLELATNMLRLVMGVEPGTEIVLTESLRELLDMSAFEATLMQSFDLNGNIDHQIMQQQILMSEKMVNMTKANSLPTITGFYRYTYKLLKPDFDMTPANVIGLQMNIPLFSSGVRNAQVKQAELDHRAAMVAGEFVADQLRIRENQLRFNYVNALETFRTQQKNVEAARKVYNNLKLKYEQGLISGLDLVSADNNYLRAETDYISAMMQVLSTRVQLQQLYGQIQ
jgi:outer membrane protein